MKQLVLALSGGGAHAAAHLGVLRALERERIEVTGIAGVSGGALIAAAWAGGADLGALIEAGANLHPWLWVRGWGGGLLSGSRLGALIDSSIPVDSFEQLRLPWSSSRRTSTRARRWSSGAARFVTRFARRAASQASSRRWSWAGAGSSTAA